MTVLSIDIGGTNFRTGLVREDGSLVKFDKVPTTSIIKSGDVLADISQYLKAFAEMDQPETAIEQPSAVAIGFPATLNRDRTQVVQAPNIAFMENLPVSEYLEKELGIPVFAERDVTFALYYDVDKYQLPLDGIVTGIYFGTGIGNALLMDGKPLKGRHGTAGELGHVPVPGCDIPCGCGNKGCLEAVAGGKALARIQREQFPETSLSELFSVHGSEPVIREVIDAMAVAVAAEVNILDPDRILLGGGVLNMKDFPKDLLNDLILEHVRKPLPWKDLPLICAGDESDKSVVGGASYARRQLAKN